MLTMNELLAVYKYRLSKKEDMVSLKQVIEDLENVRLRRKLMEAEKKK